MPEDPAAVGRPCWRSLQPAPWSSSLPCPQAHGFLSGGALVPRLRGDVHLIEPRALPETDTSSPHDELWIESEEGLLCEAGVA